MPLNCPRCSRHLSDSTDTAEQPLFCMYCGQKLRTPSPDETLAPVVQPAPINTLLSYDPDAAPDESPDHAITRSIANDPSDPDPAEPKDAAPSQVAGFRLLRFIGGGGMGNVYEAESPATGEKVAIKLLSRRLSSNPASVERFRQEGRLASQISHPRCVFVMRADTENGRPFIVMELMPGRTLKDVVDDRGPLPVADAVARILDVIDGLIEAHRLGVIHRDVKPSNCFLTDDDRVKVGDFGLSKSLAGSTPDKQLTHSGTFLGTVLFAPPEQIRHEPVGYDSDVYAVSATLYYLLAGRAPHQHESLTAVLAKAISEPAPSLRPKRPEVPAELDRIVLKGLERDRTRRYQSLEELRDALLDQLPSQQRPATPRLMTLAYLIDWVVLMPLTIPLEVLHQYLAEQPSIRIQMGESSWIGLLVTVLYFTIGEGIYGTTLGKRLLRLRVTRLGQAGPPGLKWAALRTVIYNGVWLVMLGELNSLLQPVIGKMAAALLFVPLFFIGLAVLLLQLRKSAHGYRGVHDFAAGTRTVRRIDSTRRTRLISRFPNPLDRTMKSVIPLPPSVGGFVVTGKACEIDDGGEVWVGEDKSLGRRVIVKVEPPGTGDDSMFDEPVVRPSRLRAVSHGTIHWGGGERAWVAYVAPAGSPLPDVISPTGPLAWAAAREVLNDLVSELSEGTDDGTVPKVLSVDQVWVEPGGRAQLLDFPLPTGQAVAAGETKSRYPGGAFDPSKFVKHVTALMLEGATRNGRKPVRAPLPLRAKEIVNRIMSDRYKDLKTLHADLKENLTHPPEVGVGMRAGHLTVQGMMLAFGLALMLLFSGILSLGNAYASKKAADRGQMIDEWIDSVDKRNTLISLIEKPLARPASDLSQESRDKRRTATKWLSSEQYPETARRLSRLAEQERRQAEQTESQITRPEGAVLHSIAENTNAFGLSGERSDADKVYPLIDRLESAAHLEETAHEFALGVKVVFITLACLLLIWPLFIWPLFAVVFRGGLSFWFAGLTLVRTDGRPAGRLRCGVREWLVWLPFTAFLFASLFIQYKFPSLVTLRTACWLVAAFTLPVMVAIALRKPAQGPHDRLLGTHVVPV